MYEKQEWSDVYGETPFNADRMKHIEDGVYENSKNINKYDTIVFIKNTAQTFSSDTYDNVITFNDANKNNENCYLKDGRIYHTEKVKKISVTFNLWTNVSDPKNLGLRSTNLGFTKNTIEPKNNSNQIHQTIEFSPNGAGYIDLSMYQAGIVNGDSMWCWALVNIEYVD